MQYEMHAGYPVSQPRPPDFWGRNKAAHGLARVFLSTVELSGDKSRPGFPAMTQAYRSPTLLGSSWLTWLVRFAEINVSRLG